MLRVLDIILFTLAPLNRLEYLVAQSVTASPFVVWVVLRKGHVFAGFPLALSYILLSIFLAYSFGFSVRRLLDVGVETKAGAALCVLGCNAICNLLAMGVGKSVLPVTYLVYYSGLLLMPSAKPRPMWTQDLRR
jgi:hypothetical protein